MAITNLTNTKWVFPKHFYINENIDETYNIDFISNSENFEHISITRIAFPVKGDDKLLIQLFIIYGNNSAYSYSSDGETTSSVWENDNYRIIEITGGTDVTNSDLIQWLEANAIQVPVVDLSNTKWVFGNTIDVSTNFDYQLNFLDKVNIGYYELEVSSDVILGGKSLFCIEDADGYDVTNTAFNSINGWQDNNYKNIEFISGTDIANPDLIVWLTENATLQTTTYKTFDLSTLQLSAGTHEIKVKARAAGYRDSEFSNSVNFVVKNDYVVDIVYNVPEPSPNGHAEEYGTQYYSTDDGSTWVRMNDSSSIRATQIKFKTDIESTGVHIIITFDGTDIIDTDTVGTIISNNYVLSANAAVNVYHYAPCFAENTKIKLADGTDKFVQDITYDDELLVWDFYEGKLAKAKPCWIKITQEINHYSEITLDNGTVMRLVGPHGHRLFCVERQEMIYSNELVGFHAYTLNGIAKVLSCKNVQEHVKYYNLTTEKYLDCFADGVLTGSRLNNMYHITDMKYDSNVRLISEEEEAERWRVREALRK